MASNYVENMVHHLEQTQTDEGRRAIYRLTEQLREKHGYSDDVALSKAVEHCLGFKTTWRQRVFFARYPQLANHP